MSHWPNPLIEQRADPFILRYQNSYYFIASVPEYDRLEIRRADTLAGLAKAAAIVIWRKPDDGPMSALIWAPELHRIDGRWVIYFAAALSPEIKAGLFQHRMFALTCDADDPLTGDWVERGQIHTPSTAFHWMPPILCTRARTGICGRRKTRRSPVTLISIWRNCLPPGKSAASLSC